MTELNGALDGLGLPAIVRFLAGLRMTGWLRVVHEDWHGELFFEGGRVVAAAFGNRTGLAAIEALIQALPEGQFTFTTASEGPPAEQRNVHLTSDELLARLDELVQAAQAAPSLPPLTAVPVVVPQEDGGDADNLRLDRGTLQTLLAVDGHRTVREIVTARGSFEALWQLGSLARLGVIDLNDAGAQQAARPAARAASATAAPLEAPVARPSNPPPSAPFTAPGEPPARRPFTPPAEPPVARPPAPPASAPSTPSEPPVARPTSPPAEAPQPRFAPAARVETPEPRMAAAPPVEAPAPRPVAGPTAWPAAPVAPPASPAAPSAPMGEPRTRQAPVVHCPKLGLDGDPSHAVDEPTRQHRCYAFGTPLSLPIEQQRELCLTDHYPTCPRLEAANAPAAVDKAPVAAQPRRMGQPTAEPASARPQPLSRVAASARQLGLPGGVNNRLLTIGGVALLVAVVGLLLVPRLLDNGEEVVAIPTVPATAQPAQPAAQSAPTRAAAPGGQQQPGAPAQQQQAPTAASQPQAPAAAQQPGGAQQPTPAAGGQSPVFPAAPSQPATGAQPAATTAANAPAANVANPAAQGNQTPTGPRVLLDERFAANDRGWPDNPNGPATLTSGTYRLTAQANQFTAIGAPIVDTLRDVVVGASFKKLAGPAGGGFGLIVRDQGPDARDGVSQGGRYYVLEVGDKGEVGIWRRETDRWIDLLPWQHSDAVRPGNDSNEMIVRAVGDQLTLQVNGTTVGTRTDTALAAGRVGLFVGGDQNQIAVDHFWVQAP